ncbi:hypothetical protein BJ878DRAFT_491316 [Calycina marina]|uniref:Calcium channel YVC1-like C-terminal transmembrane domain-containing protein n=1 Tax=Calycina marina TaxID=1763456 RepID=A0A9P7Z8Y0_9HELO|nr:hypothetical protein BJ878DRAFT_491316 [Calycina marina]
MESSEIPVEALEKMVVYLPDIGDEDAFAEVVKTLSIYFVEEFPTPSTFEQLRTTSAGTKIRILVDHLVLNVTNSALINALLTLKWHFNTLDIDDRGLNETRANACEIAAWRFLSRISERDAVEFCLYELPKPDSDSDSDAEAAKLQPTEHSSLLPQFRANESSTSSTPTRPPRGRRDELLRSVSHIGGVFADGEDGEDDEEDSTSSFTGLNSLEIAAVADCKSFMSQRIVQKIIHGIWNGNITFWESLTTHTQKKPQFYNKRRSDHFIRLRVPRYVKAFEVLFFATFLFLYYAVLVERNPYHFTALEILLYVWFAAFAYDELSEFIDAGSIFYAADIWNGCDLIIITIGAVFFITRIVGRMKDSDSIVDTAFDILSLEALFIVPRIFSLLSLHPYFGTLIPCLKAMTKDFVKFMVVVAVLYIGFLTTFSLLARDNYTLTEMSWVLIKVFFGSSYIGFDIMYDINAYMGPPLMIVFVVMTQILLVTSLISILSNSFSNIISHAREEYLFVYSIYVLEASTSNRLTHFYPPLNLIALLFLRPLRLFISAERLRNVRIVVLKVTHLPIVGAIWLFEISSGRVHGSVLEFSSLGPLQSTTELIEPAYDGRSSKAAKQKQKPDLSKASIGRSIHNLHDYDIADGRAETLEMKQDDTGSGRTEILEKKVDHLTIKIAELTALIMSQHNNSSEES